MPPAVPQIATAPTLPPATYRNTERASFANYVPMSSTTNWYRLTPTPSVVGGINTWAIWFAALTPLWGLLLGLLFSLFAPFATRTSAGLQVSLSISLAVSMLILAQQDAIGLRQHGLKPPSALLAFLLPTAFFIVRTVRVGKQGAGPLVTYLALQFMILVVALVLVIPPLLALVTASSPLSAQQRAAQLTPDGAAAHLTASLKAAGQTADSVLCSPFPSFAAGTPTTCVVTIDGQSAVIVICVSPEQPRTAFITCKP